MLCQTQFSFVLLKVPLPRRDIFVLEYLYFNKFIFFAGKSYICLAIIDLVSDTLFDDDYQCVDVNDGAVVLDCARGMQLKHIEHIYEFQDL